MGTRSFSSGAGLINPELINEVLILSCTSCIGAPQQLHTIAGRALIIDTTGLIASTSCNKAMLRLQFGCKKPKLRALRKPFGSTCCSTSHKNSAPGRQRISRCLLQLF